MITRTWADPCPQCGGEVDPKRLSYEAETVIDNPESVFSVKDPNCPYDEDDPDSPDCTCLAVINPSPPAYADMHVVVGAKFTMYPCGCVIRAPRGTGGKWGGPMRDWKMYQQDVPEPGSLGELMQDWAATEEATGDTNAT